MFYIKATAIDLIDNSSYPEIVLCEFNDIYGIKHRIIEKWSVVSREKFDNIFPKDSYIGCIIVEKKRSRLSLIQINHGTLNQQKEKTFSKYTKAVWLQITNNKSPDRL